MDETNRRTTLRKELLKVFEDLFELSPEDVGETAGLRDELGLDSLDGADLRAELQERFNLRISESRFVKIRRVDEVLDALDELAPRS